MRRKTGFPHCCDDLLGRYGGYKRPRDQQAVCQISGRYGLYSFLWSGKTTNPCPDVQVVMTCHDINVTPIHYPPRWCRCSFKRPRTCPRFPWSSLRSRSQRTTPTRIGSPSQPCPPKCPPLHHWHRRRRRPMGRRRRLRWSRPSKASPELRPWRCRQRRHLRRSFQLFQQQLRRRWPPNQVGAPNAGALVDFDAGNDGHGMARVVILFEVQDRELFALLLKQSKLWRTYMVRVNSRKSRTLWVTLGNFGHCTVFIGRLSEDSNLPSTPRSFTCVFFCRLLLPYG